LEPMYECPGSSVRYVLIDRSAVLGERAAHYWSRSEGAAFYSMLAEEEEKYTEENGLEDPAEHQDVEASSEQAEEEEPMVKRRAVGSNFP